MFEILLSWPPAAEITGRYHMPPIGLTLVNVTVKVVLHFWAYRPSPYPLSIFGTKYHVPQAGLFIFYVADSALDFLIFPTAPP